MKWKLVLVGIITATSLCLLACVSGIAPQKEALIEVSCDDFSGRQRITRGVTISDDGFVTVTLCSNPTTGFQWSDPAQISDQTRLQQTSHEFVPPASDLVGAAGKEVWTFKAFQKGTVEVSMEYRRSWEDDEEAERTFLLTVTIKPF